MRLARHLRWIVLALPVALAACEETASAASSRGAVEQGPFQVSEYAARVFFNRVCVDTYPSIEAARAVIAKLPFTRNPQTGIYRHQKLNLSFRLAKGAGGQACSMEFATGSRISIQSSMQFANGVMDAGLAPIKQTNVLADRTAITVDLNGNGVFRFGPTDLSGKPFYYSAAILKK